jgi:hypothetical protein
LVPWTKRGKTQLDDSVNSAQFAWAKPARDLQTSWIQPIFGYQPIALYVHMRRFLPVARAEKEAVRTVAQDRRHEQIPLYNKHGPKAAPVHGDMRTIW